MPKLIRITTVPMALKLLLPGQMKYMASHGFEVIMVSADGPERDQVIRNEGLPHVIVPMTRSITPLKDLQSLVQLYRLFCREKPDIVHSHTPKAGLLAMVAARMAGVKIRVHTVAGLRFMTAAGSTRKVLVQMEKLTGSAATHVWPNSRSLYDYIREHRLVRPGKLEVIGHGSSNGIDLQRFSKSSLTEAGKESARQAIGFDPALRYLLCVGRLVKDKGIAELVSAFSNLAARHPDLRLVLVGSMEEELDPLDPATIEVLRTHKAIIQTGWRNDIENFMAISHLLIHPSYREGFPNVLLQAGALGCPILCSRIPGNIDIVDDGHTGIIFEVSDAADLEMKLAAALDAPAEMQQMADALSTKIRTYFDRNVIHEAINLKYRELLNDQ